MTDGLWGALISGGIALLLFYLQYRTRNRAVHDAWQSQAEELRNELRQSHQETVSFLQGQLLAKDVENARVVAQLADLARKHREPSAGDANDGP